MTRLTQVVFTLLFLLISAAIPVGAQVETPIYSFNAKNDGRNPSSKVIFHANHLFGTTAGGGCQGLGIAYMLNPPRTGQTDWTRGILHCFVGSGGGDGASPSGPVIADSKGNLYGMTRDNGAEICCGLVYKLTPPPAGGTTWTETIIYGFKEDGSEGAYPDGGLAMDSAGNLYGSTQFGGAAGGGTVFMLSPPAAGATLWTHTILYSFPGRVDDGANPNGNLLLDPSGTLLGTTLNGGAFGFGTVFEIVPPTSSNPSWTENAIHYFESDATDAHDGASPNGGLVGRVGQVFGTTRIGGAANSCCGMVFELVQLVEGSPLYTLENLHSFTGGRDGAYPNAGLFVDASGNMWGTTKEGGGGTTGSDFGTIFKFTPPRTPFGSWGYGVVYSFNGGPNDGAFPLSTLTADKEGNLYGTTGNGGESGLGTVYKLTP
jgi:uncharacterized repeat protein (TIGR03803 family)